MTITKEQHRKRKDQGPSVPASANHMTVLQRLLLESAAITAGIVPILEARFDFGRVLQTLPPEEARKLKRRFRKLQRQAVKRLKQLSIARIQSDKRSTCFPHNNHLERASELNAVLCGIPGNSPSREQLRNRKSLVQKKLWQEDVVPRLQTHEAYVASSNVVD